ncbi:MFS quinate transporter QutD [Thozetella sp. PMI_491]|nr:MFS quinate transporter QutD [Thozetella sp. PMI_491]
MPNLFSRNDQSAVPAPEAVYNWKVYGLAVSAAMGSAMFGYDSAFVGGAITLPSFQSRFGLSSSSGEGLAALKANIVSTFQAGCFFGALFCYFLCEKLGRRIPLILCGALFNVGAILQVASPGNLGMIYGGRALTGLAVGASSLIVPQYISECSPPAIRGRLIGVFEIVLQFAQIIGFWVNYGVNQNISSRLDSQWQIPFALQLLPGSLLVLFMFFQPESPRWLIKAGREEQAMHNLSRIRSLPSNDPYILWEVDSVKEQLQREHDLGAHRSLWKQLSEVFASGNRNRLFLGMGLMMLQNLSGINALNYYSATIFQSVGFTGTSVGLLATGVFGIVKTTATAVFMIFGVDRLGRRKSLLIGSAGALVAMFYLGGYTTVSKSFSGQAPQDGGAYLAIVMIYLFAIFYAMSWNGIPWIFCAEVFPIAIRSACLVFTTCTQWLGQFIIVYSTPYMMANIKSGTFLFFGASLVVGIVVVFFLMPETKGLSLEEMDIMFSTKGSAIQMRRKADEILAAQRESERVVGPDEKEAVAHIEESV